ncbi:MAG: efflux RND transporter periplasmic adaptor subunit [Saprospiraceae bacterium]|nr:efflux RND transporter periplasmic adaptor subunit [Saprospiraceae bacterium]
MKNSKVIFLIVGALVVGLGLGYLLFGRNQASQPPMDSMHEHEHEHESAEEEVWTCSMHPQIRQNEAGICPICEMDLIPAGVSASDDPLVLEMTEEAAKLAQIETTILGSTGSSNKELTLSGKLQADERLVASQVAHIPGRIEQLFVTFTGEQVKKGQKLASVYSPELVAAQQELLEALQLKATNPELIAATRQKLRYWKIPPATIEQIEASGEIQETFVLEAEVSGTVKKRHVAVGDHVNAGTILFDIVSLHKLWAQFDAYEEDLAHIKIGDQISFSTSALPGQTFKTRINFIDPLINAQTRTASIRGEISNTRRFLKPEMFIQGQLSARPRSTSQLLVPKTAVLWTGPRSVVYVKVPNTSIPSFSYREVELGDRVGDSYQVNKGLEVGEEVVTYGSFTIDAAAQLNNQRSMMNRSVSIKGVEAPAVPDYAASTSSAFKSALGDLALVYLPIKDALVETDAEATAAATKAFITQLQQINQEGLEGEASIHWEKQSRSMLAHTKRIGEAQEVELQRKQFDVLSDLLINAIKSFGIEDEVLYIQHCPMAFDNTGAEWLSTEEGILNPYFGDKMLRCGFVQETLDKNYQLAEED